MSDCEPPRYPESNSALALIRTRHRTPRTHLRKRPDQEGENSGGLPYTWYKDFVLSGADEYHLPKDYVERFITPVQAKPDLRPGKDTQRAGVRYV